MRVIIVCIHHGTIWKIGSHAKFVILLKYRNILVVEVVRVHAFRD